MKNPRYLFAAATLLAALAGCEVAQAQPGLTVELVASGLGSSLYVTAAPGDSQRLFVVEQSGQILVILNGEVLDTPFLDITDRVRSGGERGLLGLAFHPNYSQNGRFFVNYTTEQPGTLTTRVSEFSVTGDPNVADPQSEQVLLTYAQPVSNHNGGCIQFGPFDGYLYIASGDGGSSNDPNDLAQNLDTLLGKMLRIAVDEVPGEVQDSGGASYDIPPDNPFIGQPGARPEIWAYGLRNPWRFSFDRFTGNAFIADVGQGAFEEINFQPFDSAGGENYGWRIFEGNRCNTTVETEEACDLLAPEATAPFYTYGRDQGRSVTGGYVYRGSAIPSLRGTYFFADFGSGEIASLRYDGNALTALTERTEELNAGGANLTLIASFGEDNAGELYIVSIAGSVWRIVPAGGTVEGEGEGALPGAPHTADRNADLAIDLGELLRVIQFFNSNGLCCAVGSEDGYAPAPCDGGTDCAPHAADFNPADFQITLSELLRVVQFFNVNGYTPCPDAGTEDGFCPATA